MLRIGVWTGLALTALSGCAPDGPAAPSGAPVDVTLSEVVPTVATARWTPVNDDLVGAHVEFGLDDSYGMTAPATSTEHGDLTAQLLGMKAGATYHVRAVEEYEGQILQGEDGTLDTGEAPIHLPQMQVSTDLSPTPGFLLLPVLSVPPVAAILDTDGDYVWWYTEEDGYIPGLFRVTPSLDERSVFFQLPSGAPNYGDQGEVVSMSFDGTDMVPLEGSRGGSHEFVELPDGSLALIRSESREVDGRTIHGDRIVELDRDGNATTVWSVWDHFEHDPVAFPADQYGGDWSHANALDHDADHDLYHLSLRGFGTILAIDRATGDVLWAFGGETSDYRDSNGSTDLIRLQHQFELLDGSLLIHDNRSGDDFASRAVEYALDPESGLAEVVWEYEAEPPYYNYALGDVTRLPSGNTLVTWSMGGQIDEVTPDGDLVWRLNAELGCGFGYVTWVERLQ